MNNALAYRYVFAADLVLEDVQGSLVLALLAVESLHGPEQVLLDARQIACPQSRWWILDASTPVGRDINRIFLGFVRREFTPGSFGIEPVVNTVTQPWESLSLEAITSASGRATA